MYVTISWSDYGGQDIYYIIKDIQCMLSAKFIKIICGLFLPGA